MNPPAWLAMFLLVAVMVTVVFMVATRVRTVPEGHVAIVHRFDKYERTVPPGLYLLRPMEEEVARLYIRQREARAVVPNVFTEGGLPVDVNLRYSYSLDPSRMHRDEIHYDDEERNEQLRTLLKRVFQDLMYQLGQMPAPSVSAGDDPDRVNVTRLFSPFAGSKARALQTSLEPAVRGALLPHGIIVTDAPVLINGLTLPPAISTAYMDLFHADFDSTARADFVRRMRKAAPGMTEGGLVQLLNIIQNPSASIQSIFSGGTLSYEVLTQGNQENTLRTVHQPAANIGPTATTAHQPGASTPLEPEKQVTAKKANQDDAGRNDAGTATPSSEPGMDPDYPLTEDDNVLLKTTREEIA
ncbi:MAG: SPFH domain-containing protein [Caldilineaceae bacterium]